MGIETTHAWHFNELRSRARTGEEGLGSPWNPYCRRNAAFFPMMLRSARLNGILYVVSAWSLCFAAVSGHERRICSEVDCALGAAALVTAHAVSVMIRSAS
jgi:hypothetical protein